MLAWGVATGTLELLWAGAAGGTPGRAGAVGEGKRAPSNWASLYPRAAGDSPGARVGSGVPLGMVVSCWSGLIWLRGGDPPENWGVLTGSQRQAAGRSR